MKVLIISDMEGVAGICRWEQVSAGRSGYEEGRRLYTEELNAAVRGAFDGAPRDRGAPGPLRRVAGNAESCAKRPEWKAEYVCRGVRAHPGHDRHLTARVTVVHDSATSDSFRVSDPHPASSLERYGAVRLDRHGRTVQACACDPHGR